MKPDELAEWLVGKQIAGVKWHSYLDWPLCIEEITLDDGSIIEMAGNADDARIDSVRLLDGTFLVPEFEEDEG